MKQEEPILGGNSNLISEVKRGAEVAEVKEIYTWRTLEMRRVGDPKTAPTRNGPKPTLTIHTVGR